MQDCRGTTAAAPRRGGAVDEVGGDGEVVVDEVGRVGGVGVDAADLGGGDDHRVGAARAQAGEDGGLVAQVERGTIGGEDLDLVVATGLAHEGGADHAAVAGDEEMLK
jgi:hypothetical protein